LGRIKFLFQTLLTAEVANENTKRILSGRTDDRCCRDGHSDGDCASQLFRLCNQRQDSRCDVGFVDQACANEQYFQDNRSYVAGPACNADTTTSQHFDFSCSVAGTATNFTLQAVGKSAMAGFTYRLDESGNKSTAIAAPAPTRWLATSPTAPATTGGCWVTNTGGSC
jgi:hypothetical protein